MTTWPDGSRRSRQAKPRVAHAICTRHGGDESRLVDAQGRAVSADRPSRTGQAGRLYRRRAVLPRATAGLCCRARIDHAAARSGGLLLRARRERPASRPAGARSACRGRPAEIPAGRGRSFRARQAIQRFALRPSTASGSRGPNTCREQVGEELARRDARDQARLRSEESFQPGKNDQRRTFPN